VKPVILAGGLTPENVRCAILQVRPAGVDAHTGVERADGMKDPALVRAFVEEARRAFALLKKKDV
jgi:phosphoribosylanthranilate isomerase